MSSFRFPTSKNALLPAVAMVLMATSALAGPTPAQKCGASKNGVLGNYMKCVHAAFAKSAAGGPFDAYKCSENLQTKWNLAETKGAGACPDTATFPELETFLSQHPYFVATMLTGTTGIPDCGDGVINQVGEQCDGGAFGVTTCETLGYGGGVLACDDNCRFDAANCSSCPNGTVEVGEECWLLSDSDQSCTAACAARGMTCQEATVVAFGSGGTDGDCAAAMNLLAPFGAPWTASTYDLSGCGTPAANSIGCVLQRGFSLVKRVVHSVPTTCGADNGGPGCFLGAGPERACACK